MKKNNLQIDDQKTIKRSLSNNKKQLIILKKLKEIENINYPLKKHFQTDELVQKNQIKSFLSTKQLQANQKYNKTQLFNSINQQTKQKQYNQRTNIELNQNQNQNYKKSDSFDNVNKCCMRLFTFMESTQKSKFNEESNKQNVFPSNKLKNNKHSQFPLQQKNKLLGKISSNQIKNLQLKNQNEQLQQRIQSQELISFIEGSRKKRQQLLIQLEKIGLDSLQNIYSDKFETYTPHQGLKYSQQHQKISKKANSVKNNLSDRNSSSNYFRKSSQGNEGKSSRIVMKEHLKQRHCSEINLNDKNRRFSIQTQDYKNKKLSKTNQTQNKVKRNRYKSIIRSNSYSQLKTLEPIKLNTSRINTCRNKDKISKQKQNLLQKLSYRKSISKIKKISPKQAYGNQKVNLDPKLIKQNKQKQINQKNCSYKQQESALKEATLSQKQKNMQKLLKRKRQLQNELLNVNDSIVFFNKKKRKEPRHHK